MNSTSARARLLRHVRPVVPLVFPSEEPESEHMGQSRRHFRMCQALYEVLRGATGQGTEHSIGCDQFVYFDASNPKRVLAPDGFVKLGVADHDFDSWKTWELGVPELAFEILSPHDSPERWTFEEKLERYRALAVNELVVFHVNGEVGSRLRVWDRIDDDLVERVVEEEKTPCLTLDAFLLIAPLFDGGSELPGCVRLARDPERTDLVLTNAEVGRLHSDRAQSAEGRAQSAEGRAQSAEGRAQSAEEKLREAERRLAELEARSHQPD